MARDKRLTVQLARYLSKRLGEAGLDEVEDPRDPRGRVWPLVTLLTAAVAGLASGKKSLAETELLTEDMPLPIRKALRVPRPVPDTTLRHVLMAIRPRALIGLLYRTVRAARRRKAIEPFGFPFHIASFDGRSTSTWLLDGENAQFQSGSDGGVPHALVRTVTACLTTARARPCIGMVPIPPKTNEMAHYTKVLDDMDAAYGPDFFRVVFYDSGANSEANGRYTVEHHHDYIFRLKGEQPTMHAEAVRTLGGLADDTALAKTAENAGGKVVVRRLWLTTEMAGFHGWEHLRTVVRVSATTEDKTTHEITVDNRYYLTSLPPDALTPDQWIAATRGHWAVENNCHNTFDKVFQEDKRPWIKAPAGMLAVMALRRLVYTLLALFRAVTLRSEEKHQLPWKRLLEAIYDYFVHGTASVVTNQTATQSTVALP